MPLRFQITPHLSTCKWATPHGFRMTDHIGVDLSVNRTASGWRNPVQLPLLGLQDSGGPESRHFPSTPSTGPPPSRISSLSLQFAPVALLHRIFGAAPTSVSDKLVSEFSRYPCALSLSDPHNVADQAHDVAGIVLAVRVGVPDRPTTSSLSDNEGWKAVGDDAGADPIRRRKSSNLPVRI